MARKRTPRADGSKTDPNSVPETASSPETPAVEDAVIVEEIPPEAEAKAEETESVRNPVDSGDAAPGPDAALQESQPASETTEETAPTEAETASEPDRALQKASPVPMVIGGAIAAALGAGAVWLLQPGPPPLAPVNGDIARLESRLTSLENAPVPTEASATSVEDLVTEAEQAAIAEAVAPLADLAARLEALEARVTALTEQGIQVVPAEQGAVVAAELQEMRATLAAQKAENEAQQQENAAIRSELTEIAARAREEVAAAEAKAAELQDIAANRAARAARQAALARVVAASETGAPFGDALADLGAAGLDVAALQGAAETGVPTLLELQRSYPEIAREALAVSRKATMGESPTDRALAFVTTQLGARSLEPRDGDDPDAVLSRTEAALRAGQLDKVLAEIDTLPEEGKAVLAPWMARV